MSGKFFRLSQRIDSNIIIRAIRHALIITVPILMIGSFALLLKSLPIWSYQNFIINFGGGIFFDLFSLIYNACFSFFSLYLVINISFCYLMEYTSSIEDYITIPTVAMAGFLIIINIGTDRFDISDLSVNGTFIALITSVTISILSKKFQNIAKGWITRPDGTNYSVPHNSDSCPRLQKRPHTIHLHHQNAPQSDSANC